MQRLRTFLDGHCDNTAVVEIIDGLMVACKDIAYRLHLGSLAGVLGSAEQENVQGECQKKLDVISNDLIKDCLAAIPSVKGLASEEEELPVACNASGEYLVLFDPLDGSSNIDVNVTVGTIFSILKAAADSDAATEAAYLQSGKQQVAAGYVLYGPSTLLVLTTGDGVFSFTLDPRIGEFVLERQNIRISETTQEFAINMSNQRFWLPEMQQYVSDLLQGEEGPLGKRYNMRWIASMVAEIHRILTRGGIFMYPYDSRDPGKPGKLRLMYEGNPMSMLVEQAGGMASTAFENIMTVKPEGIHQRVSVVMGSSQEVETAISYHVKN
ncbi:MAG: class 1 fructose-bisphosphatase [Thalassolituus sp.]|jgi:fructose-1,6-bisphosphatase I|uniref:Fructose-1,6-bisphosphatase class 1 n=1 Tax=Thalassolituus oleivorans MIL-1 TaxID=1298593 RepID=M5DMI9_9GAMM|nr:class 1 fructose-bisphosphatase [Thalassolituus oleivorans]MBQ0727616.1 class 1 fructose-bisphosphatase [Thalassolituus oleivorans]MBQ0779827.1 class 1 fructose-bisphosphatase [Thalassolituus oleivorans]MCA6126633.1 fructose 1,6-bisphosphatase [Thalassolituus oleivorans 4BN06-13]MDF1639548.1 class 1 fructose-bisphosphatase [Thalassolituus oleivorans]CCU71105.1 inositol phosphatase/fructose-1,6-bisphosphatase [Thalassolituus oleivorans MIL-1]